METREIEYPKIPEAKITSNKGDNLLRTHVPENWIIRNLDGDYDFGFDAFVQIYEKETKSVKASFLMQVKTSGLPCEDVIKVRLKTSTLNYYLSTPQPVLLVYLCINTTPSKAYYAFVQDQLLAKLDGNFELIKNAQSTTFPISKDNLLTKQTDLLDEIHQYSLLMMDLRCKSIAGKLHSKFSEKDLPDFNLNYANHTTFEPRYFCEGRQYVHSKTQVRVDAFLPSPGNNQGSCLININQGETRDCLISFSEKVMLQSLFSGYLSPFDSEESRSYIVSRCFDDNSRFVLQLGNCRLTVDTEILLQLAEILDDLCRQCLDRYKNIENLFAAGRCEYSRRYEHGFQLITIYRGLWAAIINFANENAYHKRDKDWNFFTYNGNSLYLTHSRQANNLGRLVISPERYQSLGSNYQSPDDLVTLSWNSQQLLSRYGVPNTDKLVTLCDVERAKLWLIEELIPTVIYRLQKPVEKRYFLFSKTLTFEQYLSQYDKTLYIHFDHSNRSLLTLSNLYDRKSAVELLQETSSFFGQARLNVFYTQAEVQTLYDAIIHLVKTATNVELRNLYLNCFLNDENKDIEAALHERKAQLSDGITDKFFVRSLVNSMIVLLESNNYEYIVLFQCSNYLSPFLLKTFEMVLLDKQLARFQNSP